MADLTLSSIQLGNSATAANNFIIKVPAVPDGTLSIARGDGAVVASIDAGGKVVFPSNIRNWKDVTALRVVGATYTNNTGQPLVVNIKYAYGATMGTGINVNIDGQSVGFGNTGSSTYASSGSCYVEIPAGDTYQAIQNSGTATIVLWQELSV